MILWDIWMVKLYLRVRKRHIWLDFFNQPMLSSFSQLIVLHLLFCPMRLLHLYCLFLNLLLLLPCHPFFSLDWYFIFFTKLMLGFTHTLALLFVLQWLSFNPRTLTLIVILCAFYFHRPRFHLTHKENILTHICMHTLCHTLTHTHRNPPAEQSSELLAARCLLSKHE